MLSNWFLCRSRTFVSPFHRGGTLNGSSRHWIGNVSSSERAFFLTPNCSLQLSGRGQRPNSCNYGSPVLLRARSENGQTYWSKAPIDCGADCVSQSGPPRTTSALATTRLPVMCAVHGQATDQTCKQCSAER